METNKEMLEVTSKAPAHTAHASRRVEVEPSSTTATGPNLEYQPLPSQDSIRLLSIHEHDDVTPKAVHCTLSTYSSGIPYKALSYVCGDAGNLETLHVNSVQVRARSNLYHALLEISRDSSRPLLWVDALCIDQANLKERNAQVARMSKIYTNAVEVIIWLGVEDRGDPKRDISRGLTETISVANDDDVVEDVEVLTLNAHMVVVHNAWFERCWTMQELILARAVTVRLGSHEISWKRLSTLMERAFIRGMELATDDLDHEPDEIGAIVHSALEAMQLETLAKMFRDSRLTLSLLLSESWRRYASEPLDKVFAIMGMFPTPLVTIDYSQTPAKVCKAATLACILREGNLNILDLARFRRGVGNGRMPEATSNLLPEKAPEEFEVPSWTLSLPYQDEPEEWHLAAMEGIQDTTEPPHCLSEEALDRIRADPDIDVLSLHGEVHGRVTHEQKVEPIPSCMVNAAEITNSTRNETFRGLKTLLEDFTRHDQGNCDCANSDRLRADGHVWINPHWFVNARTGDLYCTIHGACCAYMLRPQRLGHRRCLVSPSTDHADLKLIQVEDTGTSPILQSIAWIREKQVVQGADGNSPSVWPELPIEIPLA